MDPVHILPCLSLYGVIRRTPKVISRRKQSVFGGLYRMYIFRMHALFLLLLLTCASVVAQTPSPDPCKALLPASLREVLPKRFPGYRLARVSDYVKRDVDQHKKKNNGNPCLGIASTDVDGDSFPDFAFFLTYKSRHTLLIAARNVAGKTWEISKLDDFGKEGPGHSYVEVMEPGSYKDMYAAADAPAEYKPEPGRVRRFKAIHSGFIAGTIESSGVAFFFTGKRWVHLWLSD